ncbi:MAG: ATP-binding protein [Ktedonobacteraceae bacterium]
MPKLSELVLRQLIEGGETNEVEFKVASPRPDEMAERLCGLANAQGGFIIIGIKDESLDIVGIPDKKIAQTKDVILRATRQVIKPELLLDPSEPEVYVLDGKKLVVATVPPNRGAVYQVSGVFWVRRGTYTVPLTVSEIMELAHDRGLVRWEQQVVREATMKDIDVELVRAYISQRAGGSGQSSRLKNLERVLTGMGCAKATPDGPVRPTYAGILFFGHDPQQYILQSEVVCVLFQDELGVGRYIDRKIIRGTFQRLIDDTEAFLNKYVAVGAEIVGWKRIDLPEYPLEALREAVVNAIVHRDYSRVGESIRVFYYADRVEIHSPGLLLPGITVEQMQRGEITSRLRNPILATLLRDIPGYMERIGSGIRFMLNETKRMGLQPPQFREMSEFVVTFRKAPVSRASRARATSLAGNEGELQQLTLDVLTDIPSRANSSSPRILDQRVRIELAMRHIQEYGSILNREYRNLTGVSEQTAMRDLEMLVEQGTLKKVGKTRARQYKLP